MDDANRSIATALAAILVFVPASAPLSAQAVVDAGNRYPSVAAVIVWRVDEAANPVELRGLASGTLIRERVNNRLDTRRVQNWIADAMRQHSGAR